MIRPVIDTYIYICIYIYTLSPPFYLLYLEVIYALTLKIASKRHVTWRIYSARREEGHVFSAFFLLPLGTGSV